LAKSAARDEIFKDNSVAPADFHFGEKVASVFDDMLMRSVPFYEEMQRMISEMATDFAADGSQIYDLCCSTGNTLIHLDGYVPKGIKFIGVDSSEEMLHRCRQKLAASKFDRAHELVCADLNKGVHIANASMVLMVLTL